VAHRAEHIARADPAVLIHALFTSGLRVGNPACLAACEPAGVARARDSAEVLYAGELEIRLGEGLVLANGQPLTLSVREFDLLAAMARRFGAVVTREELYGTVWGAPLRRGDRSVDVYVSKLRSKLEGVMPDRRYIHTHPGFGYRFQPQPAAGQVHPEGGGESSGSGPNPLQDIHIAATAGQETDTATPDRRRLSPAQPA
jgi:DNA-binding response OmpR family regulator